MQCSCSRRSGQRVPRRPAAEPLAASLPAAVRRGLSRRRRRAAGVAPARVGNPRVGRNRRGLLLRHDATPAAARAFPRGLPRRPQAARALHHLLDHLALLALHRLSAARALSQAARTAGALLVFSPQLHR